ncbi:MAG: hypothetical protein HRT44_08055 [Bdellovibrionales bacterium]|nr:hypothetical protein [Bdellovibrionales bacterium]NQZ19191.1 hypothetical protein [Bdellovibrionales bacterium]
MQSINLLTHQWAENKFPMSRYLPETTSTNDIAKEEFLSLSIDEALYLTDHQTQGRGRGKRSWQNMSQGEVLLSTWCFKVKHSVHYILTPLLGLSLYNSLKRIKKNLPLKLKAPNDIFLNDGKLSGLLVEVTSQGDDTFISVGLGINVFAAPEIDIMTSHLSEEVTIDTQSWFSFCDEFYRLAKNSIKESQQEHLSETQCEQIMEALNQRVYGDDKVLRVHPNCDIETSQGLTSWMNL